MVFGTDPPAKHDACADTANTTQMSGSRYIQYSNSGETVLGENGHNASPVNRDNSCEPVTKFLVLRTLLKKKKIKKFRRRLIIF